MDAPTKDTPTKDPPEHQRGFAAGPGCTRPSRETCGFSPNSVACSLQPLSLLGPVVFAGRGWGHPTLEWGASPALGLCAPPAREPRIPRVLPEQPLPLGQMSTAELLDRSPGRQDELWALKTCQEGRVWKEAAGVKDRRTDRRTGGGTRPGGPKAGDCGRLGRLRVNSYACPSAMAAPEQSPASHAAFGDSSERQ